MISSAGTSFNADFGLSTDEDETFGLSVFLRDEARTFAFAARLLHHGVFVNPVIAPGVARGQELLRCTVNSQLSDDQIDTALAAFAAVGAEVN